VWFFRLVILWFSREQRLCDALVRTWLRRNDEAQLKSLEAEGFDVSDARALLAALEAEDAPKPIASRTTQPLATPPALPAPSTKRPPDQPKKTAGPGASFRSGKPAH
jgi:hypothetical protein